LIGNFLFFTHVVTNGQLALEKIHSVFSWRKKQFFPLISRFIFRKTSVD